MSGADLAAHVDLARQWREWLWKNGYSPVPIRNGTKFPTARRWPERARLGEFANIPPDSESLGTGIECSGLRPVDFDIDDDAIIGRILLLPSDILIPPGAIRFRDGSPRMVWLYRAEEGNPRKRTIKGAHGTVEVLGHGQQFVAIGMHPSGVPYQWDRTLPPRDSLPAITEQQVELLFDKIAPLIGAVAVAKSQQRTHERLQPKSDWSKLIERIKSGEQWHDNMLRLIAHWVAVKRDDAEILAWAEPLTLAGYTADQTMQEMQTMIDGARAKGFDQRETRKEAAQAALAAAAAGSISNAGLSLDGVKELPQRQRIIETALGAGVTFWQDSDGNAYATVPTAGRLERYKVPSSAFRRLLRSFYADRWPERTPRRSIPGSMSATALAEALPALEAMALKGDLREPGLRVMRWAEAIWLDLGDPDWRLVRITADGWQVVSSADVPLIRPNGMRPLPIPSSDPSALKKLRCLVNSGSDRNFQLKVCWLVAALYPDGPYPVLAIDGEAGSGKTTTCRILRRLIDPNKADLRAPSKTEDDLVIAATSARIVGLDNVSGMTAEMLDAYCRLATGTGIGKRRLYSDDEEMILAAARPILMNGIPSQLARGDLADRAIADSLPTIPDDQRREEAAIWADFKAAAPGILGLLLDGIVTALRNLPTLHLGRLPRMADFARLACAAAPAFGWKPADILEAIEENRGVAVATVIDGEPLAAAILEIAKEPNESGKLGWEGTATQLLKRINEKTLWDVQRKPSWPTDGARLSGRLKRIAPALRRVGVSIEKVRQGSKGERTITIGLLDQADSPSVASVASAAKGNQGLGADARTETADADSPVADGISSRSVSLNPMKTNGTDGADSADAISTAIQFSLQASDGRSKHDGFGAFAAPQMLPMTADTQPAKGSR